MKQDEIKTEKKSMALEQIDHASVAIAETAKARVQAAYIMAIKMPRDIDQARIQILKSCERPLFALKAIYKKPVGFENGKRKYIEGLSIRFAETAIQLFRNIYTETQVMFENEYVRRIKVMVTDLETNSSHAKEIVIAKTVERRKISDDRELIGTRLNSDGVMIYIVRATDDEVQNKEAAMVSKVLRNEGLRLIPSDIKDEAVELIQKTLLKKDAEDPEAAKKKILDAFASIGVLPKNVKEYLGHEIDTLSPVELKDLRQIYSAIESGEAAWNDFVQAKEETQAAKDKSKVDNLKNKLRKEKTSTNGDTKTEEPQTEPEAGGILNDAVKELESRCMEIGVPNDIITKICVESEGDEQILKDFLTNIITVGQLKTIRMFLNKKSKPENHPEMLRAYFSDLKIEKSFLWELTKTEAQKVVDYLIAKK